MVGFFNIIRSLHVGLQQYLVEIMMMFFVSQRLLKEEAPAQLLKSL